MYHSTQFNYNKADYRTVTGQRKLIGLEKSENERNLVNKVEIGTMVIADVWKKL